MKHIIYLHGLASTAKIFTHLHAKLPKHRATFIEYDSSASLEDILKSIEHQVPRTEPVNIIAHSLGGIVGKFLLMRHKDVKVDSLVSIATPFAGSETAARLRWFFPQFRILRDLNPRADVLKEIRDAKVPNFSSIITTSGNLPFVVDANDGVVTLKSQRATTASNVVEVDANHFEVLQDEQTIGALKTLIFGSNK